METQDPAAELARLTQLRAVRAGMTGWEANVRAIDQRIAELKQALDGAS